MISESDFMTYPTSPLLIIMVVYYNTTYSRYANKGPKKSL